MKIFIAADMEGISGVTTWEQVDSSHAEYARFRKIMIQEVNAAIRGAVEAGAQEIVVADGHASGSNILIEELHPRARLNTGRPSPYAMVSGVDGTCAGAMFVGYHARAGTQNAILDHTWSSKAVANVWLNEILVGETGLNAAVCGHFSVPVLMVSGDQALCKEAQELLGEIEVAVVKQATGRQAAECLPLGLAQEKICEAAARAVSRLQAGGAPPPFRLPSPIQLEVELNHSVMADRAVLLPGVVRRDGRRLTYQATDMLTAQHAFRAMVSLAVG